MQEKLENGVDKGKWFEAFLTDLSKAFDCLSHELLIAKLHPYGFDLPALELIQSYLSDRKQRTNIDATYSSWEETLFGVPQGSILVSLLFDLELGDPFWIMCETDFVSYADDNTPYVLWDSVDYVIKLLENHSINLFQWFLDSQIKRNSDRCSKQSCMITSKQSCMNLKTRNINIENSACEKLLGVKVNKKLNFNEHLYGIIKNVIR